MAETLEEAEEDYIVWSNIRYYEQSSYARRVDIIKSFLLQKDNKWLYCDFIIVFQIDFFSESML